MTEYTENHLRELANKGIIVILKSNDKYAKIQFTGFSAEWIRII